MPADTAVRPLPNRRMPRVDALPAQPRGRQTRAAILDAALHRAASDGLEGLSIGALAEAMGMSKSGVFAHFGSRDGLQIAVVREYHARFSAEVFEPALALPRGLPRLRAMVERWLKRVSVEVDSGCIYISGAVEFDDRPGAVRDALAAMVRDWHVALERAIVQSIDAGHLPRETDVQQVLFELHGLVLALHHDARFLRRPGAFERARIGIERLLSPHAAPSVLSAPSAAPVPIRPVPSRPEPL